MQKQANRTFLVTFLLFSLGCATTQQLLIKADVTYATSVFALDDLEFAACHGTPIILSASACADLDPKVARALQDVQHLTFAIQQAPATVPTDLSALLADLNMVQGILSQLQQIPIIQDLAKKTTEANTKAIALLAKLTGTK